MSVGTSSFTHQDVKAMAMVGRVVTHANAQYAIRCVEGHDWFAFESAPQVTKIDFNMTPAPWITEPVATLIPAGRSLGDGFGKEVPIGDVRLGVCLVKTYR